MTIDWTASGMLYVTMLLAAFVHELGHALVGFAQGASHAWICLIGHPEDKRVLAVPCGPITLEVHIGPRLFSVPRMWTSPRKQGGATADLLFAAGGPTASALMGLVLALTTHRLVPWPLRTWLGDLLWWNWWLLLWPLVPMHYGGGFPSDGRRIIEALRTLRASRSPSQSE